MKLFKAYMGKGFPQEGLKTAGLWKIYYNTGLEIINNNNPVGIIMLTTYHPQRWHKYWQINGSTTIHH